MNESVHGLQPAYRESGQPNIRGLTAHLKDAARLVWDDVAGLLKEVEMRQASVEELFARLLTTMLPEGLKVAACHVFNRDGVVGPVCKMTLYDSKVWAGLPTARGTVLIPAQAVFALVEVTRVLTVGAVRRAEELFSSLRSLWMPGQEQPLTMFLALEGASALKVRDQLSPGQDCSLDVLGILGRWLIVFQGGKEEAGPLVRQQAGQKRFPRIDYAGQNTPIVLHQLLHQQVLPEHRGAEHDALRSDLGGMVTSLLPLYDLTYCRQYRERLSSLAKERMRRNPSPETILFCEDFLSYLDTVHGQRNFAPRV